MKTWDEVAATDEFQSMPEEERATLRDYYLREATASLPEEERPIAFQHLQKVTEPSIESSYMAERIAKGVGKGLLQDYVASVPKQAAIAQTGASLYRDRVAKDVASIIPKDQKKFERLVQYFEENPHLTSEQRVEIVKKRQGLRRHISPDGSATSWIPDTTRSYQHTAMAPMEYGIALEVADTGVLSPENKELLGKRLEKAVQNYDRSAEEYRRAEDTVTKPEDRALWKAGQAVSDFADDALVLSPEDEQKTSTQIGRGLGQMGGMIATGAVSGPAAFAGGMTMTGVEGYEDAKRSGATIQQQIEASAFGNLIGTTEALPVEPLVDKLVGNRVPRVVRQRLGGFLGRVGSKIKDYSRAGIVSAIEETIQEGTQTGARNWWAQLNYDPERDVLEGVSEAAEQGGTVGGVAGALVEMIAPGRNRAAGESQRPAGGVAPSDTPPPSTGYPESEVTELHAPEEDVFAVDPDAEQYIPEEERPVYAGELRREGGTPAFDPRTINLDPAERELSDDLPDVDLPSLEGEAADQWPWKEAPDSTPMEITVRPSDRLKGDAQQLEEVLETDRPVADIVEEDTAAEEGFIPVARNEETQGAVLYNAQTGEIRTVGEAPEVTTVKVPVTEETDANLAAVTQVIAREETVAPTEKQKESGNYKKGAMKLHGFEVRIETPKGAERTGTNPDGTPWAVQMPSDYGYISRTKGADKEQVDVYIGDTPTSTQAFVVDQFDPDTGRFDEHKVMMGYNSAEEALQAYQSAFNDGRGGERAAGVSTLSIEELRKWLKEGQLAQPYSDTAKEQDDASRIREAKLDAIPRQDGQFVLGPKEGNGTRAKHRSYSPPTQQELNYLEAIGQQIQNFQTGYRMTSEVDGQGSTGETIGVKSESPKWFQDLKVTRKQVISTIDKMKSYKPLSIVEGRIAEAMLAEVRGTREENIRQYEQVRDGRKHEAVLRLAEELSLPHQGVADAALLEEMAYLIENMETNGLVEVAHRIASAMDAYIKSADLNPDLAKDLQEEAQIQQEAGLGAENNIPFFEDELAATPQADNPLEVPDENNQLGRPDQVSPQAQQIAGQSGGESIQPEQQKGAAQPEQNISEAGGNDKQAEVSSQPSKPLQKETGGSYKTIYVRISNNSKYWSVVARNRDEAIKAVADSMGVQPSSYFRTMLKRPLNPPEATFDTRPKPAVEQTAAGAQTVVPGAERISDKALAQRKMEERKKASKPQQDVDFGLFDTGARAQGDIFDAPQSKPNQDLPLNTQEYEKQQVSEEKPVAQDLPLNTSDADKQAESRKEIGGTFTLTEFRKLLPKLEAAELSADEVRTEFKRVMDAKESVKDEIGKMTIQQILRTFGIYKRSDFNKDDYINTAFTNLLGEFYYNNSFSYDPFSEKVEDAYQRLVGRQTDEDIAKGVARRKEMIERGKQVRKETSEALKDPKTLEDYRTKVRAEGVESLSNDQLAAYDALVAEARVAAMTEQDEKRREVQGVQSSENINTSDIIKTVHTKKNTDLFVVQLDQRVERETFSVLNSTAKRLGGYYSSYNKSGAVPGFQFPTNEAASKFKQAAAGDAVVKDVARTPEDRADKLDAAGKKLEARGEEKMNQDRKENTARRAAMAASAEADAAAIISRGKLMQKLSGLVRSGKAGMLGRVTAQTEIDTIHKVMRRAKLENVRKMKDLTYDQRRKEEAKPFTNEDARLVEYPLPAFHKDNAMNVANDLMKAPGFKMTAKHIAKKAEKPGKDGMVRITDAKHIAKIKEAAEKLDNAVGWVAEEGVQDYMRLQRLGITNTNLLRNAVRDYAALIEGSPSTNAVKAAERELAGRKFDGYFPTPKEVADRMASWLDLKPSHRVLEPSAGKGSLIEAAIAAGADVKKIDAFEVAGPLRSVLELKGFGLAGRDFTEEATKTEDYDRIIMNPPFEKGQDIDHVRQAYNLLKPGGKMAAIMGEGAFFRSDSKAADFRDWLDSVGGESEQLGAGTFKESGTNVNSRLVFIEKPDSVTKDEEVVLFRVDDRAPFYSALERSIYNLDQKKAPAAQWQGIIAKLTQKGVKQDEIEWSGVREWLEGQEGSVTKEQVLAYLEESRVVLEDVVLEDEANTVQYKKWTMPGFNENYKELLITMPVRQKKLPPVTKIPDDLELVFDRLAEKGEQYFYSSTETKAAEPLNGLRFADAESAKSATLDYLTESKQLRADWKAEDDSYKSPHFREKNILAHVRFDDRINENGDKVLFIEEIQSDWHQEGRKQGYSRNMPADIQESLDRQLRAVNQARDEASFTLNEIVSVAEANGPKSNEGLAREMFGKAYGFELTQDEFDAIRKAKADAVLPPSKLAELPPRVQTAVKDIMHHQSYDIVRAAVGQDGYTNYYSEQDARQALEAVGVNLEKLNEYREKHLAAKRAASVYSKLVNEAEKKYRAGVPNAPMKKTWHELAFKRALHWAAINGYDSVAWTTGQQQADRYPEMIAHVKEFSILKNDTQDKKPYQLVVTLKSGDELDGYSRSGKSLDREELEATVGSEFADKLVKGAEKNAEKPYAEREWFDVPSGDFVMGDKGMKGFYDKMLPMYANKLVKKWGAKVETLNINLGEAPSHDKPSRDIDADDFKAALKYAEEAGNERLAQKYKDGIKHLESGLAGLELDTELYTSRFMDMALKYRSTAGDIVHSVKITDAMRESVSDGLPMFQKEDVAQPTMQRLRAPAVKNWTRKKKKVASRVKRALRQTFGQNINLKFVDEIVDREAGVSVSGVFHQKPTDAGLENVIYVALRGRSEDAALGTLSHEGIHFLRRTGALDGVWPMLRKLAETEWIKKYDIESKYKKNTQEVKIEEAIAEAYADWVEGKLQGRTPYGAIRLFQKIKSFIRRVKSMLNNDGYKNAEEVFEDIMAGRFRGAANNAQTEQGETVAFQKRTGPRREQIKTEAKYRYQKGGSNLKRWARRNFTSTGLFDKETFNLKIESDGIKNADEFDIAALAKDFEKAVKEVYGKSYDRLSDEELAAMRDYLAGGSTVPGAGDLFSSASARQMPEAMKKHIAHLREYLDRQSAKMQDAMSEIVQLRVSDLTEVQQEQLSLYVLTNGEQGRMPANIYNLINMIQTIESNKGSYLNRSYQAFDDPDWLEKVTRNKELMARGVAFMKNENSELTDAEALGAVRALLQQAYDKGNFVSLISSGGKAGSKDISFLKRRKDVPEVIRELLGEYTDPKVNFIRSASKMSNYLSGHYFTMGLRNRALGDFIFQRPVEEFDTRLAVKGNEALSPLDGLYTHRDFVTAMEDAAGSNSQGWPEWVQFAVAVNSMVKYGKTILAPTTQFRNFMSAAMFTVMNGHFNWMHSVKAFKATKSDLFTNDQKWNSYISDLIRRGVLHDNPYSSELREAINDVANQGWIDRKGPTKSLLDTMTKLYRTGDDFWKIIGYENEKTRLIKRGMTVQQASRKAAQRIRDGYPTYSLVPRAVRGMRLFPFAGTFVSFPWEMIRTTKNQFVFLAEDIKDGDTQAVAQRLVGMAAAFSLADVVRELTKEAIGLDDEDDEAVRRMGPPWQQNAALAYTGYDDNGLPVYMDLSHIDPYSYLKRPIYSIVRGTENTTKNIKSAVVEILDPFTGPEISAQAFLEVAFNSKINGGPVYNKASDTLSQTGGIMNHLRKALQPGAAGNAERMIKAISGESSASGKEYKVGDELAALVGFRMTTLNAPQSLVYQTYDFMDTKRDATRILNRVVSSRNEVTNEELTSAFNQMVKARNRAYDKMIENVSAAQKLGSTPAELYALLDNVGLSREDAASIVLLKTPLPWKSGDAYMMQNTVRRILTTPEKEKRQELLRDMAVRLGEVQRLEASQYSEFVKNYNESLKKNKAR